jgi:signal transduction histidine kinase
MSITTKILALVAVLVLFTGVTATGYHVLVGQVRDMATRQTTEMMLQHYRNELKDLVDAMASTLGAAAAGVKDERETHRIFTSLVKSARFFPDSSGYYFIYKVGGTVFVLPTLPDLEGQNLLDKQDPRGTPFIRQLDQVSQAGGGFVEYWFNKPGKGVLPKLSYARMIPGTGYWVGTGVYIDDVEEKKARVLGEIHGATRSFLWKLYAAVGNGFLVVVVPFVAFLVISIIRPLRELTAVAESYSMGHLDLPVPGLKRRDEIGSLARALGRLGTSMKKAMQMLHVG